METDTPTLVLVAGALLALGLAASLAAKRLRVPGLLLFLGVGMAIGTDGLSLIDFHNYALAQRIGVTALGLILFEGGLSAGFAEIRGVLRPALSLAFLGTLATAAVTGIVAWQLFDLTLLQGLLLGSVLASTDAAATFALLRGSTLRRRVARTLEGEAGFNDPVAVLLVIGFVNAIQHPGYGVADFVVLFVKELGIGAAIGLVVGAGAVQALRRVPLATQGLYPVASIATFALAFGAGGAAQGSGFLAAYLAGLLLGGGSVPARRTIGAFHNGLSWMAQIAMFLALGLLVIPSAFGGIAGRSTLLAVVLIVAARPLAGFLSTVRTRFSLAERAVLGWAGLRGAVPMVLATFPVLAGVSGSVRFFDIAFFAVLVSTLLQGTTFVPVARRLGVTTTEPALPREVGEVGPIRELGAELVEVPVAATDVIVGRRVRDLQLPRAGVVTLIIRGEEAIPPRGSTVLEAGDRLHVLVRQEVAHRLPDLLESWRKPAAGRVEPPAQRVRGHTPIFTAGPWDPADGDPGRPASVGGIAVVDVLRLRREPPGALVVLADGRRAITGSVVAVGGPNQLRVHARRRLQAARAEGEEAWWREMLGVLGR